MLLPTVARLKELLQCLILVAYLKKEDFFTKKNYFRKKVFGPVV
jgi:hypothetical protein